MDKHRGLLTVGALLLIGGKRVPYTKTGAVIDGEKKAEGIFSVYAAEIEEKRRKLRKRGFSLAAENMPPTGRRAALWYEIVIHYVPLSGMAVAKQLARLAKNGSSVTIPWRSLADAVGRRNRAGNLVSYTERGVRTLVEGGWLKKETVGAKRGAKTTFYLVMGDFTDRTWMEDEGEGFTQDELI